MDGHAVIHRNVAAVREAVVFFGLGAEALHFSNDRQGSILWRFRGGVLGKRLCVCGVSLRIRGPDVGGEQLKEHDKGEQQG